MAYEMISWKMEGSSDVEISHRRFSHKVELATLINEIMTPDTDLVTVGRTDKQSIILHEVWKSDRYVDLNERDSIPVHFSKDIKWSEANTEQAEARFRRGVMNTRFTTRENTPNSWCVVDNMWPDTMPVVLYMREDAAGRVADILNQEWTAFLRNPD